jgi:hypothetical protein
MASVGRPQSVPKYCKWEHARFPDAAFAAVAGIGLVHVNDLEPGTPPHTITGEPHPSGPAGETAEEKARRLRDRLLRRGSATKGDQ